MRWLLTDHVLANEEIEEILVNCCASTRVTAPTLFPDRFYLPFAPIHNPIFAILDDDTIDKAVITAPRGLGKTSIINLAYPAKKILFREKKFIVPISNSATQAVMQSENLKRELTTNHIIRSIFGPIKSSVPSDAFTKDMWVTEGGTLVFPRGTGQQVRGILHNDERPDLIIGDDLEDSESVRSEDQRKKLKEWWFADVLGSTSRFRKNWKIVVIGTLLHEDSLLANLMDDPNWVHLNIDICDDNYNSLWPDFMSNEDIRKLAETYRAQGLLDTFFREYRNKAISTEDATFLQSYFKYYDEGESNLSKSKAIENVVIIDPAKTTKLHSAHSAVVGVGINLGANRIYLRDVSAGMFHPDKLYDEAIKMAQRIKANVIAIEVTSLNEFITYPLRNELMRRGIEIELVELHARAKKEDRIAGLVPFYRRGLVYHNKAVSTPLEEQLLSFPRAKRFDIMDAFAYIVELLEQGERYFYPRTDNVSELELAENKRMLEEDEMDSIFVDEEDFDYGDDIVEKASWRTV